MNNRHKNVSHEILERYKLIRAFHTCYYTQLNNNLERMAVEFFYVVESIFEGKEIDSSSLRCVDLQRINAFLRDEK
jgi:hypothetical protein